AEPALERRGNRRRHGLGIGARPTGGDVDGGKIHGRHAGDRQETGGPRAHQKQADREQRGADRPADEGFGETCAAHGVTPPGAATARARPAARAQPAAALGGSTASSGAPSRDRRPGWYRASTTGSAAVRR